MVLDPGDVQAFLIIACPNIYAAKRHALVSVCMMKFAQDDGTVHGHRWHWCTRTSTTAIDGPSKTHCSHFSSFFPFFPNHKKIVILGLCSLHPSCKLSVSLLRARKWASPTVWYDGRASVPDFVKKKKCSLDGPKWVSGLVVYQVR